MLHASRRSRAATLLAAGAVVAGVALPVATGLAAPSSVKPAVSGSPYLALGDSVAFGYREGTNNPAPDYTKPASFKGYPELIAAALGLKLTNASCPGETTSSFLKTSAQSNGCENSYVNGAKVPQGYRTNYRLHVTYTSATQSQLAFAKAFLTKNPGTRLVTLTIGANDGFVCQKSTQDQCASEFQTLLNTITTNVTKILKGLRSTGYAGQIIIVNYYSYDYRDASLKQQIIALNGALASAAAQVTNTKVANEFTAFKNASLQTGGDVCTAGLLTMLNGQPTPCGVHPSVAGAAVLAQTAAARVTK